MNGQISVRHTAAAWTDSWSVRAGSVGGAAARTSVPVNAQAASFACVKGQGKHRASPARPSAIRRALTRATSALAPYQPSVQPAVSSSGGSTANDSAVLRAPATATTEVASLYDHSVYVSGSSAAILSGDATVHGSTSAASVKSAANVGSAVPITVSRRRAPLLRLRRSIISSRIAAPLNTGTGPLVPNMLRRHMWRTRMWRSQQFSPHLIGAAAPPITPTFPVPPNMTGGLSGLSLGKRAFRRRHRPVKWQLDHSQVWRRFE